MDFDADWLPADPEIEDQVLVDGRLGLHKLAKMLGCFRRELEAEGFDEEEAYALTEAWMLKACDNAMGSDD
jgi:hypothetical protein